MNERGSGNNNNISFFFLFSSICPLCRDYASNLTSIISFLSVLKNRVYGGEKREKKEEKKKKRHIGMK